MKKRDFRNICKINDLNHAKIKFKNSIKHWQHKETSAKFKSGPVFARIMHQRFGGRVQVLFAGVLDHRNLHPWIARCFPRSLSKIQLCILKLYQLLRTAVDMKAEAKPKHDRHGSRLRSARSLTSGNVRSTLYPKIDTCTTFAAIFSTCCALIRASHLPLGLLKGLDHIEIVWTIQIVTYYVNYFAVFCVRRNTFVYIGTWVSILPQILGQI